MNERTPPSGRPAPQPSLPSWIFSFLCPTLFGKACILYFGLKYSEDPGEGYGYGLAAAVAFTLTMLGIFIWRNRNYEE